MNCSIIDAIGNDTVITIKFAIQYLIFEAYV